MAKVDSGHYTTYTLNNNVWTATTKNGMIYTFGSAATSRADNPADATKVYQWMIDEIEDSNSNKIEYEYIKWVNFPQPYKIKYQGVEVEFFLTNDSNGTYLPGYDMRQRSIDSLRVRDTSVSQNGPITNRYEFTYTTQDNAHHTYISDIKFFTRVNTGNPSSSLQELPAPSFTYSNPNPSWTQAGQNWDLPVALTFPKHVDLNADMRPDLFYESTGAVYFATDNGWQLDSNSWTLPASTLVNGWAQTSWNDFNGDGLTDYMKQGTMYFNTGSGWSMNSSGNWVISSQDWRSQHSGSGNFNTVNEFKTYTDVNGDGLLDFVYINYHYYFFRTYLNTGSGWDYSNHSFHVPRPTNFASMAMILMEMEMGCLMCSCNSTELINLFNRGHIGTQVQVGSMTLA